MQSSADLVDLIGLVAAGDQAAFSQLYATTNAQLFGIALRVLHSRPDAEDALQEIYFKVWKRAASYRHGDYSPISWLAIIARNQAIDMLRSRAPIAIDISEMADLIGTDLTPEEELVKKSQRAHIDTCIDGLAKNAALIREAYLEGVSYLELAKRHAVPVNTVRTRLRRGLAELRNVGVQRRPRVLAPPMHYDQPQDILHSLT